MTPISQVCEDKRGEDGERGRDRRGAEVEGGAHGNIENLKKRGDSESEVSVFFILFTPFFLFCFFLLFLMIIYRLDIGNEDSSGKAE